MRWRIFDGAFNANIVIDFLRHLIKGAAKKIFQILDNLRAHHAKPVKAWLAENAETIELFYFPSYSPERNPDEMANADIKQAVTTLVPARRSRSWSRPPLATRGACRGNSSEFASTSSMSRYAMPLDSISLMPDQQYSPEGAARRHLLWT